MQPLRALMNPYLPLQSLFEAPLALSDGASIVFQPTSAAGGAAGAFARMLRLIPGFDFEIGELPVVNYLSARDTGVEISALPIFLTRRFVHGIIFCNRDMGVAGPRDLEGKRVGVGYWGHSDSTWARGILAQSYGVDLESITWVTCNEEQVPSAILPPNVVHLPRVDLRLMMANRELAGTISDTGGGLDTRGAPRIERLLPDWEQAQKDWFRQTRVFPILHTVVVKNSVLREHPTLARELYAAFCAAKERAFARIDSGYQLGSEETASALQSGFPVPALAHLGPDPLPYGIEPNRKALEMLTGMALDQHVISRRAPVEELLLACE